MKDDICDEVTVSLFSSLEDVFSRISSACTSLSETVKAAAARPGSLGPDDAVRERAEQLDELRREAHRIEIQLQERLRVSEEELDALMNASLPVLEDRYGRRDVLQAPVDYDLDHILPRALERVLSAVDPDWLRAQADKEHHLDSGYLRSPLVLVGSHRLNQPTSRPQRFAQSLLLCQSHLEKCDSLDFWNLPILTAEVASLGMQMDMLAELGPYAEQKFHDLYQMTDEQEASTVYELLVGFACIKRGLAVEMLTENPPKKTPEYRVNGFSFPAVIECKRRRLPAYLIAEGSVLVDVANNPICLRWRCDNEESQQKRTRGVSSLLGSALEQIPDGEVGVVYLAYEEMARENVADARTERIIRDINGWAHRWAINVPLVMVDRVYPRPIGVGQPDVIENLIPFLAQHADRSLIGTFPTRVVVPESL